MKRKLMYPVYLITVILLVAIDQFTKHLAVIELKNSDPVSLIKGVFELFYLENRGAAFGILQGKKGFFILITSILLVFLVYLLLRLPLEKRFHLIRIVLLLFICGAIGNFIDRSWHNYVIDFFYFKLIDFPVFNVADIYVTCAAAGFIYSILFFYKEEDYDRIFPKFFHKEKKS